MAFGMKSMIHKKRETVPYIDRCGYPLKIRKFRHFLIIAVYQSLSENFYSSFFSPRFTWKIFKKRLRKKAKKAKNYLIVFFIINRYFNSVTIKPICMASATFCFTWFLKQICYTKKNAFDSCKKVYAWINYEKTTNKQKKKRSSSFSSLLFSIWANFSQFFFVF